MTATPDAVPAPAPAEAGTGVRAIERDDRRRRRRGVIAEVLMLGGYLAASIAAILLSLEPPYVTPLWSMVLLLVAGTATLLGRHRWQSVAFVTALILIPLSAVGGTTLEALVVVPILYRTALDARGGTTLWRTVATAVVVVGSGAAFAWRMESGWPLIGTGPRSLSFGWDWLNFVAIVGGAVVIAVLLGANTRHRSQLVVALRAEAAQLARERDQQADIARAAERERIAREMHDVIAHSLAVMIALSDGARAAAAKRPEESLRAVERIGETGRRTLGEVRRLLGAVREGDAAIDGAPQPSLAQVAGLVEEFRSAGLPVRLHLTGRIVDDAVAEATVFRIVQESLTNVLRHGRGVRDVDVQVEATAGEVMVIVEDTSDVAVSSTDPGRGLIGIRERVALYDGEAETGPRPTGGWRVFARLKTGER